MTEQVWTIAAALDWTRTYLAEKADEHPRRSAEWLLSAATGLSRVELYAHHDRPLSPEERAQLREGVRRRAAGEPLQYVTGEVAFRHIVVKVRPGVLIPRPETEVLLDVALPALTGPEPRALDLCTGSGCIALSIAHEAPAAVVTAIDLSPVACEVTAENAERLGYTERVRALEGDLFAPLGVDDDGSFDLIVSNPPYIPTALMDALPAEVSGFEPHLALDGGPDGLDLFRRIAEGAPRFLAAEGLLACELHEERTGAAAGLLRDAGWREVAVTRDLTGRPRIVSARRPR